MDGHSVLESKTRMKLSTVHHARGVMLQLGGERLERVLEVAQEPEHL